MLISGKLLRRNDFVGRVSLYDSILWLSANVTECMDCCCSTAGADNDRVGAEFARRRFLLSKSCCSSKTSKECLNI
jgi:hypothetical protein